VSLPNRSTSHLPSFGCALTSRFDCVLNPDTAKRFVTTITLSNGSATGITFDIWTQNEIADVIDNTPLEDAARH
jgi:hypothetical protein